MNVRLHQRAQNRRIVASGFITTTSELHYKIKDFADLFESSAHLYCLIYCAGNIVWYHTDNSPATQIYNITTLKTGYLGLETRTVIEYDENTYIHITAGSGAPVVIFQFYTLEELRLHELGRVW